MRIRIQLFYLMQIRIRILLLVKVIRICAVTNLQTLQVSVLSLHGSIASDHGSIVSL
jgi:hypothetical protein